MMSYISRKSRRRPHQLKNDISEAKPFFGKTSDTSVQKKESEAFFQPKLTIGQPGDHYEQEADAVAHAVVNQVHHHSGVQKKADGLIQRVTLATPKEEEKSGTAESSMERDKEIQEKPEIQAMDKEEEMAQMQGEEEEEMAQMQGEEEEEMAQMQGEEEEEMAQMQVEEEEEMAQMQGEEEEEMAQAKANGSTPTRTATPQLSQSLQRTKGKGNSLPKKIRQQMEKAFGADLSRVRIHTDEEAVKMNKKLRAQAFTNGVDIYFNEGKFDPDSKKGQLLLAHELTHVIQQKKL